MQNESRMILDNPPGTAGVKSSPCCVCGQLIGPECYGVGFERQPSHKNKKGLYALDTAWFCEPCIVKALLRASEKK